MSKQRKPYDVKCKSCGHTKLSTHKFLFGLCIPCQDFIIKTRAKEYNDELSRLGAEQLQQLQDKEDKIKKMRSELKTDQAAVELVKLIRSIK